MTKNVDDETRMEIIPNPSGKYVEFGNEERAYVNFFDNVLYPALSCCILNSLFHSYNFSFFFPIGEVYCNSFKLGSFFYSFIYYYYYFFVYT